MRLIYLIVYFFTISIVCKAQEKTASIFEDFKVNGARSILPDFSFAGYHYGEKEIPFLTKNVFNVSDYGIQPNAKFDQTNKIQKIIDKVGEKGGGVIFFPKGKYLLNMDSSKVNFLKINYSHIILRGEGSGVDGTIFYNGSNTLQEEISSWLSPFLIQTGYAIQGTKSFWGIDFPNPDKIPSTGVSGNNGVVNEQIKSAKILTEIISNANKGSQTLKVKSTAKLRAGDCILIGMFNTTKDGNLMKELLAPIQEFEPQETSALNAGQFSAPSYQWLVQIDEIINRSTVKLKQPLRRDIKLSFHPVIAEAQMLKEIGIENLRFESAWDGNYCHHGCKNSDPKTVKLMDYGWNAVNFCRVSNGWIKNVAINNFTNAIYLLDSRNVTIDNVKITGYDGHSGVKIYGHAADNLIKNINFECNFTHVLGGEGNAYGNVFSNINYNPKRKIPGMFDSHGFSDRRFSPPAENLFEDIKGMWKISGGGSPQNLPHMAAYNTWWNVQEAGFTDQDTELFNSWFWTSKSSNHPQKDHHKMYLKSIVVGVYIPELKLTIEGNENDRKDEWIYVENFNKGLVKPYSLYKAQLDLRLQK
ncbi:DUF4955 domain-containing protein [Pedobacter sp. SD-b]|uniref:DUF4955 domain-containing protein n=1 Tax=Pedobacter segetis TaxID=2793069 RepID=A0ABS1BPD2_9SPHI|nr:glycosyl hydrolase family 28-related protein [Pedobacter segetis]MBK0384144.1 DUF4955 domain-containing protein [Pedobacter segetis]